MAGSISISMPQDIPAPPEDLQTRLLKVDDWSATVGGWVYIVREEQVVRFGLIEMTSEDESVAWVAQTGTDSRQFISKADGHELWVAPRHLQSSEKGRHEIR